MVLVDIEQGDTQHGTVGGYQRQVDTQHPVQKGTALAHYHFSKLHDYGNDQNEGYGLEISQPQWQQQELVGQVAAGGSECQDEGGCHGHAHGGFEFIGDAHKRAQPQELYQYEIVDQNRSDQQDGVVCQHG